MSKEQADKGLGFDSPLFQRAYAPAFVETCAKRGYPIKTAEDLREAIEGTRAVIEKLESGSNNIMKAANASLGIQSAAARAAVKQENSKTAAAKEELIRNPEARKAILEALSQ